MILWDNHVIFHRISDKKQEKVKHDGSLKHLFLCKGHVFLLVVMKTFLWTRIKLLKKCIFFGLHKKSQKFTNPFFFYKIDFFLLKSIKLCCLFRNSNFLCTWIDFSAPETFYLAIRNWVILVVSIFKIFLAKISISSILFYRIKNFDITCFKIDMYFFL